MAMYIRTIDVHIPLMVLSGQFYLIHFHLRCDSVSFIFIDLCNINKGRKMIFIGFTHLCAFCIHIEC